MSNGKFFSGLPDCMMNRTNTAPDRQKSNFFWPEETDAPAPMSNRNRRSTSTKPTYDAAEYQKACDEATSPNQRKQMFHKQLESKIEFFDPPEVVTPTRRQTLKNSTPAPRKETTPNPTYFDNSCSKKREFSSNIFFNEEQEKQTPNYQKEHNINNTSQNKSNNGLDNNSVNRQGDKLDNYGGGGGRRNNEMNNVKKGQETFIDINCDNVYKNNINKLDNYAEQTNNKMNDVVRDMKAVKLSTEKVTNHKLIDHTMLYPNPRRRLSYDIDIDDDYPRVVVRPVPPPRRQNRRATVYLDQNPNYMDDPYYYYHEPILRRNNYPRQPRHWSQYDDYLHDAPVRRQAQAYDRSPQPNGNEYHGRRNEPEELFYQTSQNATTATPRPRFAYQSADEVTSTNHPNSINHQQTSTSDTNGGDTARARRPVQRSLTQRREATVATSSTSSSSSNPKRHLKSTISFTDDELDTGTDSRRPVSVRDSAVCRVGVGLPNL